MKPERLDNILRRIRTTSVAVLGDFCLDAYWLTNPRLSETSVETGKSTLAVATQRYSLGGAGNIVANLVDLGVRRVHALGVVGNDLFGGEMVRMLRALGADAAGMQVQSSSWATPVYGKLYVGEDELPRTDFGVSNTIARQTEDALVAALQRLLPKVQAVILNQQLARGIASDRLIRELNRLTRRHPDHVFVLDSRNRSDRFKNVIYRFNAHEAARLCGHDHPLDQGVRLEDALSFARRIARKSRRPVYISRGDRGSIVAAGRRIEIIPGIQIMGKTDTVGAGDTSVSALSAALAVGATPLEAGHLANFASAVTVQKLRTTGTASPSEIRAIGQSPDYVHRPELASDPRAAHFWKGTEIELVTDSWPRGRIRHALFDHDGTISTLRQGWEPIMLNVCIRSIMGPAFQTADETVYNRVAGRVRDYISRSTGIQTIEQMRMLVDMVREFGFVPARQILDAAGYKRIYLKALMEKVGRRVAKLGRGELDVQDFTIKGAVAFLNALKQRGVRLYLASGTDHKDVVREARALGYAGLFDGGIYGAVDSSGQDAKKQVIEDLFKNRRLSGSELACFGDGPVELREARKRSGIAIGIASDEVRRYGLVTEKRARLICAGADIVVPDFTQRAALLRCLLG